MDDAIKVTIKGKNAGKIRKLADEYSSSNNEVANKLIALVINEPLRIEKKELKITICEE